MNIVRRIIFCFCFLTLAQNAMAAAPSAVKTGNWNDHTVWSTNLVPTSADVVTVAGGFTVTVDASGPAQCKTLTVGTAAGAAGTVIMGQNLGGSPFAGLGSLSVSGAVSVLATGTFQANTVLPVTNTLSVAGNITNTGVFNMSPGMTEVCDVTITAASIISGAGAYTFNNLTISAAGLTVTASVSPTINGNLNVVAGTYSIGTTTLNIPNDSLTVSNGAILKASTGIIDVAAGNINIQNGATIQFTGAGTLTAATVNNNGTLTCLTATINPTNLVNYGSGVITVTTGKLIPSGNLVQESSSNITFSGAGTITTGGDLDISSASIVGAGGLITVDKNLNFTGGSVSSITQTGAGSLTVVGNSSIGSMGGISLVTGTYTSTGTFTLNGSLTYTGAGALKIAGSTAAFNGTWTPGTSTVTFNGAASQTLSGTILPAIPFYNLTITNTAAALSGVSLGNAVQVTHTLTLSAATGNFSTGANSLEVDGTFANNNTTAGANSFQAGTGTVTFGSGATTLSGTQATTFNNLTINSVASTVTVTATAAAPSEIIGGNLFISSGTFAPAAKTLDVKGNFTNNATFAFGTSTMIFNGGANQTINSSAALEFYNLTISNSGVAGSNQVYLGISPALAFTVDATLLISTGVLKCEDVRIAGGGVAGGKVNMTGGMMVLGLQSNTTTAAPAFPTGFAAAATLTGGTVVYQDGNAGQVVSITPTYFNLSLYSGAAGNTFTLAAGTLTVAGSLDIGDSLTGGVILNAGTNTIKLTGSAATYTALINPDGEISFSGAGTFDVACNLTNNSTLAGATPGFIASTSTTVFNGTKNQSLGGTNPYTFNNFQINNTGAASNNTVTLGDAITVNGTLTLTKGILDVNPAGNYQITCNGTLTNSTGTTTGLNPENGTVIFTPSGSVNIAQTAAGTETVFYNLNLNPGSNTITVTNAGAHVPAVQVNNNLFILSGTFAAVATTVNVTGAATIVSGSSATLTTGKLGVTGNIYNMGTINCGSTATVTSNNFYNRTGATYNGGTAASTTTVSGFLYDSSTVAMAFATGTVNVTDSTFIIGSGAITFSGAGKLQVPTADVYNNGTISFGGAGAFKASNFYNNSGATFAGFSTTGTISKSIYNFSATFSITTGTYTITDSVYNAPGATMTASTGRYNASGDINNSGTVTFTGAGGVTTSNFYNNSGGTFTGLTSINNITGSLYNFSTNGSPNSISLSSGTINVTDSVYNVAGASITYSAAGTLNATGNVGNYGTITFPAAAAGTFNAATLNIYTGGVVTGFTYIVKATGNVIINGTLTYTGAGGLKIGGNYVDNGTYNYSTNTTTFNGTGNQTLSGTGGPSGLPLNFYNVIVNGVGNTVTLADSVLTNKLLTLTAGTFDVSTNDYHLICKGGITNNESTSAFNARKGCVWFIGAQTVTGTSSTVFNDAVIENGSVTISKPEVFSDTLALVTATTAGTFANVSPNTVTIGNAFLNNSGAAFASSTGIILFENNTNSSCYIGSPITAKTITINKFTENLAHATDTLFLLGNNILTVSTNDTLEQGVFHCQQYNFKGAAASKLDIQDNATLILGIKSNATAVTFPTVFTGPNTTITNNSTVIYEANATQTISTTPSNYGNLYLYTSGASVNKMIAANLTVNGNMIVGDGTSTGATTLPANTFTVNLLKNETINSNGNVTFTTGPLNIGGNFTNNRGLAGFTGGSGTVKFNSATGNQTIGGTQTTTFSNVNIDNTAASGTVSLADSTIVSNAFAITAGTFDVSASNYSLVVNGGFSNNNATNSYNGESGTTYFNGAEAVGGTSSSTFYNVTYNAGAPNTVTIGDNETVNSNLLGTSGTMAVGTNTVSVTGNVTLAVAGGNLTFSSGAMTIGGSFTNNNSTAAVTGGTSTVTFNNALSTQTIGGSFTTTFNNIISSGYNVILTHNENAAGTFNISSGTFDCGASAETMAVTGTFTNGGTFLGDNSTLALSGDLTNNSTFTAQTGTVSFNKSGSENINGSHTIAFYNATLNGSAVVNINTIDESLTNILTLNGTSQLAGTGSDSLTMVSTPSATARIAPVASGASITLPFIMQRYVGGTKANYEALASPAQASSLHDWAYDPNFYMSGVGGPDGNAGSFKSVYTINEPTDAYVAVTTTAQALTPGLGLYIYMATSLSGFSPFTFSTHGLPSFGTVHYAITHSASPGTGSNLVGNPYDCPLQWTSLQTDGGGAGNGGLLGSQFSVYDRTLGNWESSDGTTASCAGCQLSGAPNIIPAHQGFLVSAVSSGTMVFNEADKTTTDESVYKPIAPATTDFVTIMLSDNMNEYQGNTAIQFKANTKPSFVVGEDVAYMPGLAEGAPVLYTLSSDGKFLNRNLQPLVDGNEQDVMFYAGGSVSGNYTLTFNGIDKLTQYGCIQLEDLRLNKAVQIEEGATYTYQLQNSGTYKFILHFKKLKAGEQCEATAFVGSANIDASTAVDVFRNNTGAVARFTYSQPQQVTISVYNALGQKLGNDITKDVMDESVEIPLPATNQMYILRIQTPTGVITKRIYQ